MQKLIIPMVLLLVFSAVACVQLEPAPGDNATNDTFTPVEEPPEEEAPMMEEEPEEEDTPVVHFTVNAVEGDLIRLNPEAIDPDGDLVRYTFDEPFSNDGEWQTQLGDEGVHFVLVVAEDGKGGRTTETIQVNVARADRPPIVECQPVVVDEGEKINLHDFCTISDEDDQEVVVTYGGWMTSWRYQTTYEDAGKHTVLITASDREGETTLHIVKKNITVTVNDVNRAPEFGDFPTEISGTEGDVLVLPVVEVSDPDGDEVTVTFSEPFGDKGVWRTGLGDAGEHSVDVVATDGEFTEKRTVKITLGLRNTAPTLTKIGSIEVDEGETITLPISATDREGDPLSITITGWMTEETYTTTYDDAGEYSVKITVTDGSFTTAQIVKITVNDVNRPPVFVVPA